MLLDSAYRLTQRVVGTDKQVDEMTAQLLWRLEEHVGSRRLTGFGARCRCRHLRTERLCARLARDARRVLTIRLGVEQEALECASM